MKYAMRTFCWVRRSTWNYFILIQALVIIAYLVYSTPNYRNKPCTPLLYNQFGHHPICRSIFNQDQAAISYASQFTWCKRNDEITEEMYISLTKDCRRFVADMNYLLYEVTMVTEEEKSFPLAFTILMHENLEQTERLLRLIYRPQNVYCIHVDAKTPALVHEAARSITSCFDNVFLSSRSVDIHWGEYTLLEAELICLRQLFEFEGVKWKYYMNLMGREFPLRTNRELVQIFKAYNGSNDIDGTIHRRPMTWTMFVWKNENWRTGELKSKPPHKFLIGKGSTHVAASRAFVDYALNDPKARDLLEWMKDIRAPDEHFFPTLNHNPLRGVPGAYIGDPGLKWFYARLKIWQSEDETCHGQWVRYICNLGVGDLKRTFTAKQLFFNKIRLEQDPVAFHCLEEWYRNRTLALVNSDFNVSFYANLPFAKSHV